MEMLKLKLVYIDYWGRPTYETEEGFLIKDVNLGDFPIERTTLTTTSSKDLESEPCTDIRHIEKYKDKKIEVVKEF